MRNPALQQCTVRFAAYTDEDAALLGSCDVGKSGTVRTNVSWGHNMHTYIYLDVLSLLVSAKVKLFCTQSIKPCQFEEMTSNTGR